MIFGVPLAHVFALLYGIIKVIKQNLYYQNSYSIRRITTSVYQFYVNDNVGNDLCAGELSFQKSIFYRTCH